MIEEIGVARTDVGVGQVFVYLERSGGHPLAVFVIASVLSDFADVDFGVEIGGESLVVVACVAIDNVQIVHFVEMVLGCIGGIDTTYAGVESATEDSGEAGLFEALLVGPLPAVFEVGFILRLIVSRIQIVHSGLQAGFHDGEVLIGECHVDDNIGFETVEKGYQFVYIVSIDLCGLYGRIADGLSDGVTF